jgi:hypothetical protein
MQCPRGKLTPFFLLILTLALSLSACDWIPRPGGGGPHPSELPDDLLPAFQNPGSWVFAESAALTCRDGSSTGIGVRLQEDDEPSRRGGPFNLDNYSDNLVIFLEGGGACFNFPSCFQNRANFSKEQFFSDDFIGGYSGIFDATHPDNPVADWNFVYVPYCTGDEHAGSNPSGDVPPVDLAFTPDNPDLPGVPDQKFVGYDNMSQVVDYLSHYLGDHFDNVLLAGSSAGGVGTLANYRQVADGFPHSKVTALDDAGPVFYDDTFLPAVLQQLWRTTWDISEVLRPPEEDNVDPSDDIERIYQAIADENPDASLGLITYEQDFTIRYFYSFGEALENPTSLCAIDLWSGLLKTDAEGNPTPERRSCIGAQEYEDALYDLRNELPKPWTTFYAVASETRPSPDELAPSERHTFLRVERFYEATAEGQSLSAWLSDLIAGDAEDRGSR